PALPQREQLSSATPPHPRRRQIPTPLIKSPLQGSMATEALGDARPALFLRNATDLVRAWNVRDSLIYTVLSTNFVTLGLFTFTYAGPSFPTGQLLTSVVISAILVSFLVVAYTGLITTIPRAGG